MNMLAQKIAEVKALAASNAILPKALIACMDLTSLNLQDNIHTIDQLCEDALTHAVACVCIYPAFVAQAHCYFSKVEKVVPHVATVANFPEGNEVINKVIGDIQKAVELGADEVDVVLPYQSVLANKDSACVVPFVQICRQHLINKKLKIIIETGAFDDFALLKEVALSCLTGGADFLKTSTGKIAQGADLQRAAIVLSAISEFGDASRGFKVSGGVRSYQQAQEYYLLTQVILQRAQLTPNDFRIGASGLLKELTHLHAGF